MLRKLYYISNRQFKYIPCLQKIYRCISIGVSQSFIVTALHNRERSILISWHRGGRGISVDRNRTGRCTLRNVSGRIVEMEITYKKRTRFINCALQYYCPPSASVPSSLWIWINLHSSLRVCIRVRFLPCKFLAIPFTLLIIDKWRLRAEQTWFGFAKFCNLLTSQTQTLFLPENSVYTRISLISSLLSVYNLKIHRIFYMYIY